MAAAGIDPVPLVERGGGRLEHDQVFLLGAESTQPSRYMRICPPVQIELKWHSLWENAVRAKQKLPEACRVFPASSPVALTTLPTTALPYLAIWSNKDKFYNGDSTNTPLLQEHTHSRTKAHCLVFPVIPGCLTCCNMEQQTQVLPPYTSPWTSILAVTL